LKSHGAANKHDCCQIYIFTQSTKETWKKKTFFLSKFLEQMRGLHSVYFAETDHCWNSFRL